MFVLGLGLSNRDFPAHAGGELNAFVFLRGNVMSNKVSFVDSRRLGSTNPYSSELVESEGPDPDLEVLSVKEQLLALRPKGTPAWVTSLRPLNPVVTGKDGWRLLVGSWPGNETDEEIDCLLKQIDDEDAERV